MDANKDGSISLEEFIANEKMKRGSVDESRSRDRFKEIDKDSDGKLSEQEIEAAPKGKGGRK
jgi:Ca2+-binding EF-hand superfamily protein